MTWQTVRLFLILSLILGWQSRQLDYVMAYPQAPAEMPLYMRLPQGYRRDGVSRKTHALNLVRNVYSQKQVGRVWNKYMDQGMKEIGFMLISFDPCLYYRGSTVFLVYIDDCIIFGPNSPSIDAVVADLRACSHRFTVDDQGDIGDFLAIQVTRFPNWSVQLTQLQLIDAIIKHLHLQSGSNTKKTPAVPNNLLDKDTDCPDMTPDSLSQCDRQVKLLREIDSTGHLSKHASVRSLHRTTKTKSCGSGQKDWVLFIRYER